MEIGTEISHKIRTAIKSKLMDLGAYVDNELPDYIMVMIANKKKKEQMVEDLSLFLGKNTEIFTDWLMEILQKLQIITAESETNLLKNKQLTSSSQIVGNKTIKVTEAEESEDFLALKAEPEDDFIEELKDESNDINNKSQKLEICVSTASQPKVISEVIRPTIKPIVKTGVRNQVSTAKVQPLNRKRKTPESVIGAVRVVPSDEEDDYEHCNPSFGSVASVVKVTEKRPIIPVEMRANKTLLLKAVEAAHKSVKETTSKPSHAWVEPFQQRPIKIFTHHYQEQLPFQQQILRQVDCKDNMLTVVHTSRPRLFEELPSKDGIIGKTLILSSAETRTKNVNKDNSDLDIEVGSQDTRLIEYNDTLLDDFPVKYLLKSTFDGDQKGVISRRIVHNSNLSSNPKFIVTLDGANEFVKKSTNLVESTDNTSSNYVSSKFSADQRNNFNHNISDDSRNSISDEPLTKKEKLVERCRFWPACKSADSCLYHHPSSQCRTFPNCKFADKCLYIHPNCKFDAKCARKDCPFTHASKRILIGATSSMNPAVATSSAQQIVCRFYPECKNMNCLFYHPKPCRFGMSCLRTDCTFYHPLPPSRNKLKWTASPTHISARTYAVTEGIESFPVSANL